MIEAGRVAAWAIGPPQMGKKRPPAPARSHVFAEHSTG